jgi:hypothetical protein
VRVPRIWTVGYCPHEFTVRSRGSRRKTRSGRDDAARRPGGIRCVELLMDLLAEWLDGAAAVCALVLSGLVVGWGSGDAGWEESSSPWWRMGVDGE